MSRLTTFLNAGNLECTKRTSKLGLDAYQHTRICIKTPFCSNCALKRDVYMKAVNTIFIGLNEVAWRDHE